MFGMSKKRADDEKGKRYPSREKVRYFALPEDLGDAFTAVAKEQDRSASSLLRKVVREFLESIGKAPPPRKKSPES